MRLAWCSDIHLDFIDDADDGRLIKFAETIRERDPDAVVVTGDISNSTRLIYHLSVLERELGRPIYFVLGNHDFFGSSIADVRGAMHKISNISQFLKYLPLQSYVTLTRTTALVGHDGWYDGLLGDADRSEFMMNDWFMIKDFIKVSGGEQYMRFARNIRDRAELLALIQCLAAEAVVHVRNGIKQAITKKHDHIIIATHVPPFAESHMHEGRQGNDQAMPWFTSKKMGDLLLDASRSFPNVKFTVLAGHTHGRYDGQPARNMTVSVAGADYRLPALAGIIEVK